MNLAITRLAFAPGLALAALALSSAAHAQDRIEYEDEDGSAYGSRSGRSGGGRVIDVTPYIEAAQVLTKELRPGDDLVTYTSLAAGVDATIAGRNNAVSVAARYERRFGWTDDTLDGDSVSGLARASLGLVGGKAVTLEAGALATRTRVEGNGASSVGGFAGDDTSTSQLYSAYVGPSVATTVGDFDVQGHYRFGYTRVESPDAVLTAPGSQPADFLDESNAHAAQASINLRPGTLVPIGVGVGGGWNEQNISNLDQRVRDRYVRGGVTVPLGPTFAVVGGVGYEDVQVSSRDAVRTAAGVPVIGSDGRYVTDKASPRRISYETDGLIWDAGVMWRPSRRTSLEARVGRRYGTMSYTGSFSYAPTSRQSFVLSAYDGVTSFGGLVNDSLSNLPAQFDAFRNPISGEIGGCVAGVERQSCIANALGSVRSSVFRNRGIAGSYSMDLGRTKIGAGAGYDRRNFIAAAGTVLAPANGVIDESVWAAIYAATRLDSRSTVNVNAAANWLDSGFDLAADTIGYSTSLSYSRSFLGGLSGTAAVGLDGITRDALPDFMSASALLGLRYSF